VRVSRPGCVRALAGRYQLMPVFSPVDNRAAVSWTSLAGRGVLLPEVTLLTLSAAVMVAMPSIGTDCAGGMMVFDGILANSYSR
jgi:hypothetical protein